MVSEGRTKLPSLMIPNVYQIVAACLVLVLVTFVVGVWLLVTRVREMRQKRIHPQAVAHRRGFGQAAVAGYLVR